MKSPAHTKSRVVATVKATRKSEHIGDFFRGIYPITPDVGEVVELGAIVDVTFEQDDTGQYFGQVTMTPWDGREVDWIDPRKLYRLHSQTVEVSIEPV